MSLFAGARNLLSVAGVLAFIAYGTFAVHGQEYIYGVSSDHQLIRMGTGGSGAMVVATITGMDSTVKGFDFRPATGQLYALAASGKLYIIDRRTAVATLVAPLSIPIVGNQFAFDFDPVADRIRIFGVNQNLNVNPNDGTVIVETPLNPGALVPIDASYTNSYKGAGTTTLYVLAGSALNKVNTPSSGTVTQLGLTISMINSMDIAPTPGNNTGLLAIETGVIKLPGAIAHINLENGAVPTFSTLSNNLVLEHVAFMPIRMLPVKLDFDRDKKTDYSVFRPSTNTWYNARSTTGTFTSVPWGTTGDILTPGDYDGDEQADIAVWRGSAGDFYILRSSDGTAQFTHFGQAGDEPLPQDFDGDGTIDLAVVRRAGGLTSWYYIESGSDQFRAVNWGLDTDRIAPADYDGDGKCDVAVRRGTGTQPAVYYILASTAGYYGVQWGLGDDMIVPGDYDGDARSDLAVVRLESTYKWYIRNSSNGAFVSYHFGAPPHVMATGDYDGDGKTDPTVFIPASGDFYSVKSTTGAVSGFHFGQSGDVPPAKNDAH